MLLGTRSALRRVSLSCTSSMCSAHVVLLQVKPELLEVRRPANGAKAKEGAAVAEEGSCCSVM